MASNSVLNPAPNPLTGQYNPELWTTTDKKKASVIIPIDTVSLLYGDTNVYTEKNTYNALVNLTTNTIIYKTSNYINSTQSLNTFTTRTLSSPLYSIYTFDNTANDGTLTLPSGVDYEGVSITFRRSATSVYRLLSATSNLVQMGTNPLTFTNEILGNGINSCTLIYAKYPTLYAWFIVNVY